MEDQKTHNRLGEIVFTGTCLVVAGFTLFLPHHHLHSQKSNPAESSHGDHKQESSAEQRDVKDGVACKNCVYDEKHFIIAGKHYTLEVADTEEKRTLGLGKREELCDDCGMLFVFEKPGQYGFWMKDMHFSIDILWIKDGKVVYKKSSASPDEQETFIPPEDADSVIEILPNTKVRVGDTVELHTHDE